MSTVLTLRKGGVPATRLPPAADRDFTIGGYASLFDRPDLGGDVVAPGAFQDSLARRGPAGVRMLWQHDPAQPVGRWLSLAEDARGLRVSGRLNSDVARARELAALLRDGAVDGLSIGFRVVETRRGRAPGTRQLMRVDLWEVSLVTFPMLPGARVDTLTHADPGAAARALAGSLRRATARLRSQPERTA